MILSDLHTHTTYCDGKNTPEEMVISAVKKGLKTFGVSAHSYTEYDTSYCMQREDISRYIAEMHYLRAKYTGKINVLCGVEQDYYSDWPTDGFDYVIGSVHAVKTGDKYFDVDNSAEVLRKAVESRFGGDPYAFCELYYETVADVVNKTHCDIIGHFDLVTKFIEKDKLFDTAHPRYAAAWKKAADKLLEYGIPFEVNTGAMSRGYRTLPYPSLEIIDYLKARSAKLILSSDAHSASDIAFAFEKLENLI